jgi:mono/diheme cytochrome c family protein
MYVYYCTRWCGVNHWRMRGTIEVTGAEDPEPETQPLFVQLGLDLDAPHLAGIVPDEKPSAARGQALGLSLPDRYLDRETYRKSAPAETWQALRADPVTQGLSDAQVWDLVAVVWARNTTPPSIETGRQLYAQNCAACHGERGGGDGVMASQIAGLGASMDDHTDEDRAMPKGPADFTDPASLLGASPALLQGKILRGGMGTGMPYWGPVFTEDQTWALVAYLQLFQFELDGEK